MEENRKDIVKNVVGAVVKLSDIVDVMELQSDTAFHYLNKKTGNIVCVTEEDITVAEEEEILEDYPDWQQETIKQAKDILATDDYLELPTQFDIHYGTVLFISERQQDYGRA